MQCCLYADTVQDDSEDNGKSYCNLKDNGTSDNQNTALGQRKSSGLGYLEMFINKCVNKCAVSRHLNKISYQTKHRKELVMSPKGLKTTVLCVISRDTK